MCRFFQQETQNLAPGAFQSLMSHDRRTYLVEVACSPDSRLSREVQRQAGYEEAAIRCSHWNGCDLGSGSGVQLVLQTITEKRPSHVWISPECGPYSPMQAVNQRTESQRAGGMQVSTVSCARKRRSAATSDSASLLVQKNP